MQFLFFLNPRFWLGVLVAIIALYSEWFARYFLFILTAAVVIAFLAYFIGYLMECKRRGK